ncbi:CLUMA_CG006669, isoform A [Clunio marinus]|uniref:CLUMA_CG006669, isoform A n=1 Tax=Clunio marinus TaxID=568069 RepID=A0A1J1HXX1_9DIPT|nr:CLUMA_CG006669, isoform A [Clunio marinus]
MFQKSLRSQTKEIGIISEARIGVMTPATIEVKRSAMPLTLPHCSLRDKFFVIINSTMFTLENEDSVFLCESCKLTMNN